MSWEIGALMWSAFTSTAREPFTSGRFARSTASSACRRASQIAETNNSAIVTGISMRSSEMIENTIETPNMTTLAASTPTSCGVSQRRFSVIQTSGGASARRRWCG